MSIAFVEDAPSLSGNFQGDAIGVEVELTNNGETDIEANGASVNLIGTITGGAFTLTQSAVVKNTGLIERIRDSGDVADSDFVDLGTATLTDNIGPSWSPNIRAQVCYPYVTEVQIDDLCIPGERNEAGSVECEIDNAENWTEINEQVDRTSYNHEIEDDEQQKDKNQTVKAGGSGSTLWRRRHCIA